MSIVTQNQTTTAAFEEFDESLKLDPKEREDAIQRWNTIADLLAEQGAVARHFLQGSFARKTMRKPLKDVDVVVVVSQDLIEDTDSDPQLVTDRLQQFISRTYPGWTFSGSKHALTVCFDDRDFTIDVTPAQEASEGYVRIANTESGEWDLSDCQLINRAVSQRNQECAGLFIRQVRMAREIAAKMKDDFPDLDVLNGLVAESILFAAVTSEASFEDAVTQFLENATVMVHGEILTPSGYEDLTVKRQWSPADRDRLGRVFEKLLATAREAARFRAAGEEASALSSWAAICGDNFPLPEVDEAEYLSGLGQGSATRAGGVTTALLTGVPVSPQRAWRRQA